MKKIVHFYRNIGIISSTIAVAEAAIGWQFHGTIGVLGSLFFVGLAVACFFIANHANDIDTKVRKSFLDHLNVIEPRLTGHKLAAEARSIRADVLQDKPLVGISQRMGTLNGKMVESGLLLNTPVPPEHI